MGTEKNTNNAYIFLIIGNSGSGKDTIVNKLCEDYLYSKVKSYTTRPQRENNKSDIQNHTFINESEFNKLDNIIAYMEDKNGYKYCATAEQIEENDLYIIDEQGVDYFIENYKGDKTPVIIYIQSSHWTCYNRMLNRGDNKEQAKQRLHNDREIRSPHFLELFENGIIDCVVRNEVCDKLENVVNRIDTIIVSYLPL